MRLAQNYITEEDLKDFSDIKIEGVSRLQFMCQFKAGRDEDHA